MNKNSFGLRSASAAAIIGLTLTLGAPAAALAQTPTATPVANPGVIDQDATTSLTIHKRSNPEGKLPNATGEKVDNAPGSPLEGVGFTVYKISDISLKDNASLAAAANKKAEDYFKKDAKGNLVPDMDKLGAGQSDETDSNGELTFSFNKGVGAYLVVESAPRDGYSPAAPFIAYLPMTDSTGAKWNYNVHAYPKNYEQGKVDKKVEDSGQNVGQEIVYKITVEAQAVSDSSQRKTLRIEDTMDDALSVDPNKVTVTGDKFKKDRDYTVTIVKTAEDKNKVVIEFTKEGLSRINNGEKIEAAIPATVSTLPDNGDVLNTAYVIENNPNTNQENDPKKTPTVETHFGGVTFTKIGGDTQKPLEGAEFELYGALNGQECKAAVKMGNQKLTVGTTNKWASGADGQVTINGLHVNGFADNKQEDNKYTQYCLVETKAPAPYELLVEPLAFTVKKNELTSLGTDGKVVNVKDTTPNLPMTGGMGIGVLAAIGAALVGAGAWFARRNSKKS